MLRKSTVLLLLLSLSSFAYAEEEPSIHGTKQANPIFQNSKGLAIGGYDPVAYFQTQKAQKGEEGIEHKWMGATWRFKTVENKDLFIKQPEKYAPQYGGYCAYGMSHGYAAPVDPRAWKIVDGKLYLNYSFDVQREWNRDIPGFIAKANENWPKIPKKQ